MKLNRLSIKNFKGIKDLEIDFNGRNTNIYGENATGKTTVYDSFLWLLFDKDSTNRKDFNLKTIDSSGNEIHMLEHEVEAIIEVNFKEITLRKVLAEKWTRKRGSSEQEYDGNETSYYIDEVPVKKSEYISKINELINENIFKLITNPQYFNTVMAWKERRELLLSICGDVTDEQVINSNEKLFELSKILDGRSTDDYGKIIKEKIKKLNNDIEKIPVRIDELNRSKSNVEDVDYESLESRLKQYNLQIDDIDKKLSDSASLSEEYNQKLLEIVQLKNKLQNVKSQIETDSRKDYTEKTNKLSNLKSQKTSKEFEIKTLSNDIEFLIKNIDKCIADREELVKKYNEISTQVFIEPDESNFKCPVCEQLLPEDDVSKKIEDMRNKFKEKQFKSIEDINATGRSIKENKEVLESKLSDYNTKLIIVKELLKTIDEEIAKIEVEIKNIEQTSEDINYESNTGYASIKSEIDKLESNLQAPASTISNELRAKKSEIQEKINNINKQFAIRDQEEKTDMRIKELEQEEKDLANKISELEKQRYLIEEFIKTKVSLIEDNISSKFKIVKFKLFDTQINGGLVETCETLVNGVPYSDVNNAGKINAGMDIIATLMEYYGVKAPIFVDNAESINDLYDLDTQIIRLVVSRDKQLKVEVL